MIVEKINCQVAEGVRYWGIREDYKAYEIAESHAMLGRKQIAIKHLITACDKFLNYSLVFVNVDPIFDGLRNEPGFASVLKRLKLDRTPAPIDLQLPVGVQRSGPAGY